MNNSRIRVGPITLAVGLVIIGLAVLAYNFKLLPSLETAWKLWPLLLIGVSAEYLIRKMLNKENRDIHFHVPSLLLIGLIVLFGSIVNAIASTDIAGVIKENVFEERQSYQRLWQSEPLAVAAGSRIVIDSKRGLVQLRPSSDGKLHVKARINAWAGNLDKARKLAEKVEVGVEPGNPLRITSEPALPDVGHWRTGNYSVTLTVEVPAGVMLELQNEMGNIEASDLVGQFTLTGKMGQVKVSNITGDMEINCENGDIVTDGVKGNLEVQNRNGSITVRDPGGNVVASSNNSSLELNSKIPLSGQYDLSTDNGRVKLFLPKNSNLNIKAESKNGSISGSVLTGKVSGNRVNEASGVLCDGKGTAWLRTENGEIVVHAYDN